MRAPPLVRWPVVAVGCLLGACGGSGDGGGGAPVGVPGTFSAGAVLATGTNPIDVAAADLNGDGRLDLAVANLGSNSVSVFLGVGDGTFVPAGSVAVGAGPVGLSLADLDGARPDLTVVCRTDRTLWSFAGAGDGTFGFQQSFTLPGSASPAALVVLAFDAFAGPDVAVALGSGGGAPIGELRVFSGNGDVTVSPVAAPFALPYPALSGGLAAGDADADGRADLFVGHFLLGGYSVARGDGLGGFLGLLTVPTSSGTAGLALAQLNGDLLPDVLASNVNAGTLSVRLGTGAGAPTAPLPSELPLGEGLSAVASADFDRDGRADVAVGLTGASVRAVQVLLGAGGGAFVPAPERLAVPGTPSGLCAGDFDGDLRPDLAVCGFDDATVRVFLGR